ncbi:MAG TPA: hypothetical protein VEG32_11010 [Clostridia bacterium]|nr:hypothetical protein [Clostridia bacterium]
MSQYATADPMSNWLHKNLVSAVALFAYVVMAIMFAEQTRVVENQRTLIKQLYNDNVELTALKMQQIKNKHPK